MLTSDLLRVRVTGKEVRPRYVDDQDSELLNLAGALIEIFQRHEGQSRGEIQADLKELLGTGTAFLLQRGLAKLLMDRCEFETDSRVEPAELRKAAFAIAAEAHGKSAEGTWNRDDVLSALGDQLDLQADEIERCLYADLKDEQVLRSFRAVTADKLLQRYNVALAQAVLFKASELRVQIADPSAERLRALLRKLKFFQLMHRLRGSVKDGFELIVDGPTSLFKSSQKYGLQMANFLPVLLHCQQWSLEADLAWGKKRVSKQFKLSPENNLKSHTNLTGQWRPPEADYLMDRFSKLKG
ncbi:MAG: DUF790 family protein, partial [Planctomycetales bacterium]